MALALAGCTPSVLRESKRAPNPLHPQPEPCVDHVALAGVAREARSEQSSVATCCPDGFVYGDGRLSVCAKGTCCPLEEDMGNPPPIPVGPLHDPVN
jgi:hypothetical protein